MRTRLLELPLYITRLKYDLATYSRLELCATSGRLELFENRILLTMYILHHDVLMGPLNRVTICLPESNGTRENPPPPILRRGPWNISNPNRDL